VGEITKVFTRDQVELELTGSIRIRFVVGSNISSQRGKRP